MTRYSWIMKYRRDGELARRIRFFGFRCQLISGFWLVVTCNGLQKIDVRNVEPVTRNQRPVTSILKPYFFGDCYLRSPKDLT
jgi:hypothetical protein